jgi:deoxyadenosine/deoxycytidine kinase
MIPTLKIGVVGPCAAGKSTLIAGLKQHGYGAKHIAQEHSYVPEMWQLISNPDVLIYLDAAYEVTVERCHLDWTQSEYNEEHQRLQHARQHAHCYINTDRLTPEEVLEQVLVFLRGWIP